MGELKLEKLMTAPEVAEILCVEVNYVWKLAREGKLKKVPNIGVVRFHPKVVENFVNGTPKKK